VRDLVVGQDAPGIPTVLLVDTDLESAAESEASMSIRLAAPGGGFAVLQDSGHDLFHRTVRGEADALEEEVQGNLWMDSIRCARRSCVGLHVVCPPSALG
jgi:hypothetical protein